MFSTAGVVSSRVSVGLWLGFSPVFVQFISINGNHSKLFGIKYFLSRCGSFLLGIVDFLHFLQIKAAHKWRNWQNEKFQILLGARLPHRDRSKPERVTPPAYYIISPQVRHNYITGEEWGQIWEDCNPFEDLFLSWYCHWYGVSVPSHSLN